MGKFRSPELSGLALRRLHQTSLSLSSRHPGRGIFKVSREQDAMTKMLTAAMIILFLFAAAWTIFFVSIAVFTALTA